MFVVFVDAFVRGTDGAMCNEHLWSNSSEDYYMYSATLISARRTETAHDKAQLSSLGQLTN
jgi:hypothetical protein